MKRTELIYLVALGFGLSMPARAAVVCHWSFEGTIGSEVGGSVADETGKYVATHVEGFDPDSTITYAAPSPWFAGSSAYFYNDNWSNDGGDVLLIPDAGVNNLAGLDFGCLSEFTVEACIYPASGAGFEQTRRIFSKEIYCYMYLDKSQTLHAIRKWGGGDWDENWTHLTAANIPLDEWTHVAMTWDAGAVGEKMKLYVNGMLVDSAGGTATATLDSGAGFAIGGYQRANLTKAQFFLGRIDEFRITGSAIDPGEFLTDPHRPVIIEGQAYPTVNTRVGEDGLLTGQIVQIDDRTHGPIDPTFDARTVLDLGPLSVSAGQLKKLVPDGTAPGPGRYEFRLVRSGPGYPDYHRSVRFTVIESSQANKGVRIGPEGSCYRDGRLWLPMVVYVNSRTDSSPDPVLRDRFLDYLEGTPFAMMDYANPRGGLAYTVDYMNRCAQRGIPMSMHAAPSVIDTQFAIQLAEALRDHPALVFYYTNDELGDDWYSQLRSMQSTLLQYDPFHPTHCEHYNMDHSIDQADCYDIYVHQFYNAGDRQIRQNFVYMAELADTVPQPIPYWGNMFLHDAKLRTMCYGCIANGAKGLMFYAFHRMWDMYDTTTFNAKWSDIVAMGQELQSRQHILLQPRAAVQATISADEVAIRTVTGNFGTWVLIANAYWQTRSATVYLNREVTSARGANGTNYSVINNRLTLTLTPEDVWLIRLFNDNEPPPPSRQLPGKQDLAVSFGAGDIIDGGSVWRWTGSGTTPEQVVSYPEPDLMRVDTGSSQRARWASDSTNSFGAADDFTGFTAQIRMRVLKSTSGSRGVDFELYVGSGSLPGKRYFATVTTTGVYWYEGGVFKPIAAGLDNSSQMHTYRMALREDGLVQIYRDEDLLGTRIADFGVDSLVAADGPYFQFGDGAASAETDFEVSSIAFDLLGPYAPGQCIVDFDDLMRFAGYWLDSEPDCEANLDGMAPVDFVDYAVLADRWLGVCPDNWPLK